ncbi:hypothetical protein Gorai_006187 [Gossypium raimondii]|uniref:Aspartic peptidase DDI1-type domain-containing protein n=1 Tax=Gossypium raimondii TaxID=29730 RepID=A0A7J8QEU3_GOSRA|nr:hypothetical protein [Gossypium raimondii]
MKEKFKEYVAEALSSNMDALQVLLNTTMAKGELALCRVAVGKGVLVAKSSHKIDVPKLKKFKGARFVKEMDNFLWEMKQYFHLVPRKDKIESSKPKEKGNGKGDKEVQIENSNNNGGDDELEKTSMKLGSIVSGAKAKRVKENKKNPVECFFLFVVCIGRRRSALVDMRASKLFISEKVMSKLGLSVSKSTKKIKTVNSKEVPIVGVVQGVKLQFSQWKGKEDFEVIHLDDYKFVLGLNFFNKINALLVSFVDCICILDTRQKQCVVSVSLDMRDGTKVLPAIQLVKDVPCGENNDLVDRSATKTLLKMLEVQKIDVKPIEVSIELPPMREIGCALDFGEKW